MAFRFIEPTADGTFQYILSREIEEPDDIYFGDTPTNGVTGVWNGNVTGSKQSIEFEGIGDKILFGVNEENTILLGTEFLLEDIGSGGAVAKDLMFETWMKISIFDNLFEGDKVLDWFDATIQRNELTTTEGFDGIYSNRIIYFDPAGDSLSAWYLDFQFAYDNLEAVSLTSANPIPEEDWKHIITMYTSGDPFNTGKLSIYVDGVLDREATIAELQSWSNPSDRLPSFGLPLPERYYSMKYSGYLDEMRMWCVSADPGTINELSSLTSIGVYPEQSGVFSGIYDQLTPSADTMVGWWRFESVSAVELLSSAPGAVLDSTRNQQDGTGYFFIAATDFSDEQHGIFGGSSAFPLLRKGTGDGGGMLVIDNLNTTLTMEEGVQNIVEPPENVWIPLSTIEPESVKVDEKQIFTGTSGVRVVTFASDGGVKHEIDYGSEYLFDNNDYVCSLRMIETSGSTSARVTFTLGHYSNSAAVTANMNRTSWTPVFVRNTASADFNESSITGSITVQSLGSEAQFNIDSIMISEGTHPPSFVAPNSVRKSGQIYWEISD